jgi:LPXTG-motif cell wall-anchored protein
MDKTGLSENPVILLTIGIIVLTFTGTLYRKLT